MTLQNQDIINTPNIVSLFNDLYKRLDHTEARMLTKKEVARLAGMTVSWLNNSQSLKARKIRSLGVRYGTAKTSPVRYPMPKVIQVCQESE